MDHNIEIDSISIPALIYNVNSKNIIFNKNFQELFNNKLEIDQFIVNNIPKITINQTKYSTYYIDEKEYFVTFIEILQRHDYLITLQDTKPMDDVIRKMHISKDLENEFYDILRVIYDDFVIVDSNGVVIKVLDNFEKTYDISNEQVIGKTIYEMEKKGIFNPSVSVRVFSTQKTETMLQMIGSNKYIMCTAIPIKDEKGNIIKVISYTRDVTKYESLKDEYNKLSETLRIYSAELEQFRQNRNIYTSGIGNSATIKNIVATIDKISKFDVNVLFTGESGVGKTMFSNLMHSQSNRKTGPFIEINCGAIPSNLVESELFGYEKGAFTGANKEGKPGLIELANNGTLFLDEIGDLPLNMQVKLLKVIQEKKIIRIGASEYRTIDFRLIAATNKNLDEMVKQGKFREDLYYRLNVITIPIPSLRERKEDIFLLCMHFLEKYRKKYSLNRALSNTVIDHLTEYDWPGNIRELENTIERLVLTTDDFMICEANLPFAMKSNMVDITYTKNKSLKEILNTIEKRVILDAYKRHKTTTGVAKELNISQPSASLKINKYLQES